MKNHKPKSKTRTNLALTFCFAAIFIFVLVKFRAKTSSSTPFPDPTNSRKFCASNFVEKDPVNFSILNEQLENSVKFVLENLVPPVYDKPYSLENPDLDDFSQYGQGEMMVEEIFNRKNNGIFLEVGAADGELYSNSLTFEKHYNWTGIIIEPDQKQFDKLKLKNRRSFALNACLSNVWQPTKVQFEAGGVGGHLSLTNEEESENQISATCLPIAAVFKALGWTKYDLVTLDTEGNEPEILVSIPWHLVDIDVLQIECTGCEEIGGRDIWKKEFMHLYMKMQGYKQIRWHTLDYFYRKIRNC